MKINDRLYIEESLIQILLRLSFYIMHVIGWIRMHLVYKRLVYWIWWLLELYKILRLLIFIRKWDVKIEIKHKKIAFFFFWKKSIKHGMALFQFRFSLFSSKIVLQDRSEEKKPKRKFTELARCSRNCCQTSWLNQTPALTCLCACLTVILVGCVVIKILILVLLSVECFQCCCDLNFYIWFLSVENSWICFYM